MADTQLKPEDLESLDIKDQQLDKLKKLYPEVFTEGKIDFEKFKQTLGENIEKDQERYNFTWAGKSNCFKAIQKPSKGTLKVDRDESVDFDNTENIFIEGENLEVLKLLQKSYIGKIKMIYIDPPYNTGKDFVYKDNFDEPLKEYLKMTGQVDEDGHKLSTNTESDGRYHSNWLNMMYPRLFLARNLLKEDGIIFISIDDNEVYNLRKICDEIFGEENLISEISWRKSDNQANIGNIARVKEYIICYGKNTEKLKLNKMELTERAKKEYRYKDEKGKFRRSILLDKTRGRHTYEVKTLSGKKLNGPWMVKEEEFQNMNKDGEIYWTKGGNEQPYGKIYLTESGGQIPNDFLGIEYGTNQQGSLEVERLLGGRYFDFPKPVSLIRHLITIGANEEDTILDFFAGSGTTAHAIFNKNINGSNLKFILVQLPERLDDTEKRKRENKDAIEFCYKLKVPRTVSEIAKERIRRVIKQIKEDKKNQQQSLLDSSDENKKQKIDLGFKVFKLAESNFKLWDGDKITEENIAEQLEWIQDHIKDNAAQEDILYELLLKQGFSLTTQIKKLTLAGKTVFSISDNAMLICLENEVTQELIDEMVKLKPLAVRFLDKAFSGNDQLKLNAIEQFKSVVEDIDFRTI